MSDGRQTVFGDFDDEITTEQTPAWTRGPMMISAFARTETFLQGRSWIHTHKGHQFFPMTAEGVIDIDDIAHALSHECRYGGHCDRFYSVAEHSVRVAEILRMQGASAVEILAGLLHDGSEAYLKDIPRPLKMLPEFAAYREAEARIQDRIYLEAGILTGNLDAVHKADRDIYGWEIRSLFSNIPAAQLVDLPPDIYFEHYSASSWNPKFAYTVFRTYYNMAVNAADSETLSNLRVSKL